jgi:hypothetical protein
MASYYDSNKATTANSRSFILDRSETQHFPFEGLYLGTLEGGTAELPALVDIGEVKGLCMLYNRNETRDCVNHCLEKLAWRIAITVPANLCDIVLYNGGNPGDAFNTHARLNKYLVGDRDERVFFDGNVESFDRVVDEAYTSIVQRMSAVNCAGKRSLVELNESLGKDAKMKYMFFILADFPHHIKMTTAQKLVQIIDSGDRAGIYMIMSWDMNAEFEDEHGFSQSFDPQSLLAKMELLFPQDNTFRFHNSGHDDLLNRFTLTLDDAAIDPAEANNWASYINNLVDVVKENVRPSALKQDFAKLENDPYESGISEISVTVGLDVNDKHPVTLRFNSGDYIHAFILGQSGSGKSVLLNDIISAAILKYSPEDLMLYLMDFKGVEFNRYRGLKHTKAVLVDNSDPQMTLEVLRELREENKRRVKLWQREGVNKIDAYNKKYPEQRLPQILFVADECQILFKKNTSNGTDRLIQQEISEILNIIATQGRSQGIHMLLATQQLDETDISGQILKNLTECFLMMSAPSDSDRLVPESSNLTSRQMTGLACYYHKQEFQSQVQTFFATDEELESAISAAQDKAIGVPGNGEHYFCGSSLYYLDQNKDLIEHSTLDCPIALIGQNIGINAGATTVPLRKDFFEHILVWGANKEEQATGVLMNALISLMMSCRSRGIDCQFFVIDCMPTTHSRYKLVLAHLAKKGLCRLIERQNSGSVLKELVEDVKNELASPTVLTIIGSERFIEIKRKMPLVKAVEDMSPESGEELLGFDMSGLDNLMSEGEAPATDDMTFPQALMYLLDEGPMNDVHVLLQIDKPSNILFGDEYDVDAANKFRHKVILRSENKFLNPLRFSKDIDVEVLGDEEERLRAYYYPDGDDPVLFTPYQMPDTETI